MPDPRPFKICTCCHRVRIWHELPFVGIQRFPDDPSLELRRCDHCHTTMARVVTDEPEAEPRRAA